MDKPVSGFGYKIIWVGGFLAAIAIAGAMPNWVLALAVGFCIGRLWEPFRAALGDTNAA